LKALGLGLKDEDEMEAIADAMEEERWAAGPQDAGDRYKACSTDAAIQLGSPRTRGKQLSTPAVEEQPQAVVDAGATRYQPCRFARARQEKAFEGFWCDRPARAVGKQASDSIS